MKKHFEELVDRVKADPRYDVLSEATTGMAGKWIIYSEIVQIKPRLVIEIGTSHGLSTFFIASALKYNNRIGSEVITIDPEKSELAETFIRDNELDDCVTFLSMTSDDAFVKYKAEWKDKVDMVFIDGDHSYEGAKKDFLNSLDIVSDQGAMLMDDAYDLGSRKRPRCGRYFRKIKNIHYCDPDPVTWNSFAKWYKSEYRPGSVYKSSMEWLAFITKAYIRKKYNKLVRPA